MTIEMGRNISQDAKTYRYFVTSEFDGKPLKFWFDTHRQAMLKFNQLRKAGATYFNVYEDPTL